MNNNLTSQEIEQSARQYFELFLSYMHAKKAVRLTLEVREHDFLVEMKGVQADHPTVPFDQKLTSKTAFAVTLPPRIILHFWRCFCPRR
jgi:hypothetical protein